MLIQIKLAGIALLCLLCGTSHAEKFIPRLSESTFTDADRTYPLVGVEADWFPIYLFENRRYKVNANKVIEITDHDKSNERTARIAEDYNLRWLGAADGIAFLVSEIDDSKFNNNEVEANSRFLRLDLDSMKWLDPFVLPEPSIKHTQKQETFLSRFANEGQKTLVLANHLIVTPRGVVVLSEESVAYRKDKDQGFLQLELIGYHVSCYSPKGTNAKWDRIIRNGQQLPRDIGYVPTSFDESISRLTFIPVEYDDDLILICPNERGKIVCLAASDGVVRWKLPALWEYERGFIGPSVYEYYIERFGLDYWIVQAAKNPVLDGDEKVESSELSKRIQHKMQSRRKLTAAREAFYSRYHGRITSGPIVIPNPDKSDNPKFYVAVSLARKVDFGVTDQPEHAIVYEIEIWPDGVEFSGMTRLPRVVIGQPYLPLPGGFILSTDNGCLVRLRNDVQNFSRGIFGPGNMARDKLLQIDWYREYQMNCPPAWLATDPPIGVAGFSKMRFFRPSMTYIRNKENKVFELQINVVDLRTGLDRDLILSVPFNGEPPIPETGLTTVSPNTPAESFYIHSPHALWIDRMSVEGKILEIVVTHGSENTALKFDLSSMLVDE